MRFHGRFRFRFPMPNTGEGAGGGGAGGAGGGDKTPATPAAVRQATVERAFQAAGLTEGGQANETQRAAAVLKDGAGADEALDAAQRRRAEQAGEVKNSASQPTAEKDGEKAEKKAAKKDGAEKGDKGEKADKGKDAGEAKAKGEKAAAKDKDAGEDDAGDDDGEADGQRQRGEDGKFRSSDPDKQRQAEEQRAADAEAERQFGEPPKRFGSDAKANEAWKDAPLSVRGAVHRVVKDLENGLAAYEPGHKEWKALIDAPSPFKGATYGQLAQTMKTTIKGALDRYVESDIRLGQDPVGTIHKILTSKGLDVKKVAEALLNVDPADLKRHIETQDLKAENERLKNEKQAGADAAARRIRADIDAEIATFKAKPEHARYDELAPIIASMISSGAAKSLAEAYEMADRAKPGRKAPDIETPDAADQTRKSELSVRGDLGNGSDPPPRDRAKPKSRKERIDRAFNEAGIR